MSKITTWWGFRLRNPNEFSAKSLSRSEAVALFLTVAVGLQVIWTSTVLIGVWSTDIINRYALLPAGMLTLAVLLGVMLPGDVRDRIPGAFWFMLAREKGQISRLDIVIALVALTSLVFAVQRLDGLAMTTSAFLFASAAGLSLCLFLFQSKTDFSQRRWKVKIPEWILPEGDGSLFDEDGKFPGGDQPDPGASPVYTFRVRDRSFHIGVKILDGLLLDLQKINAENNGRLYQTHPEATVLVDREPVSGVGQDEILRFCRQIYFACSEFELTPLQIANLVLAFVQEEFTYQYDIDSTAHLPGGPYDEYGRFALETIHDQHGDCECTSILCAALLAYLGFETALLYMVVEDCGESTGHCAVGLDAKGAFFPTMEIIDNIDYFEADDASKYLYGETATDAIIGFGSIPDEWKHKLKNKQVVKIPKPRIIH